MRESRGNVKRDIIRLSSNGFISGIIMRITLVSDAVAHVSEIPTPTEFVVRLEITLFIHADYAEVTTLPLQREFITMVGI